MNNPLSISIIDTKFNQIKEMYDSFYRKLLINGQLNCRDTNIGFWGCSSPDAVFEFFKKIQLNNYERFIDIGSGDGVVVLIASLFTNATGIEFDKELHLKALEMKEKLNLNSEFLNLDFSEINLFEYDLVYINPDKSFSRGGVEKKLLKELKGSIAIYNDIFRPNLLVKGNTFWHDQIPISLWHK